VLNDYINHLSFSNLSTYEKCPYRWYLKYIEKREDKAGDSANVGKLGHLFIKAAIAVKMRPDREAFDCLVTDIASGEHPKLTPKERKEAQALYDEYGSANLNALYEWVIYALEVLQTYKKGKVELEKKIDCIIPGIPIPIEMHIDFLSPTAIIDWKTGQNTEPITSHQLGLYAYGAGKAKGVDPATYKKVYAFTGLKKVFEDNKPVQDALDWAVNIYESLEDDLAGYSLIGKGAFRKCPGTACRYCAFKGLCYEEMMGPVELITIPDQIFSHSDAENTAYTILLLEERLKQAKEALEKYCEDNAVIVQAGGEYFGLYPGSVSRTWDKLRIFEAVRNMPSEDVIQIFNIDLRGINKLAKDNEAIRVLIQEAVTEERGKPVFKHASKPPKVS